MYKENMKGPFPLSEEGIKQIPDKTKGVAIVGERILSNFNCKTVVRSDSNLRKLLQESNLVDVPNMVFYYHLVDTIESGYRIHCETFHQYFAFEAAFKMPSPEHPKAPDGMALTCPQCAALADSPRK